MNILFFTEDEINPTMGGIERVTSILSKTFTEVYHANVFSLFLNPVTDPSNDLFIRKMCWNNVRDVRTFIEVNEIDIIVCQRQIPEIEILRNLLHERRDKCVFINVFHNMPGYEITTWRYLIYYMHYTNLKGKIKSIIKLLFYPLYKSYLLKKASKVMRMADSSSDISILLSSRYEKLYKNIYGISKTASCCAINNPLSYSNFFQMTEYSLKRHILLVVSRLDERQKRLSLLLKIWGRIQNETNDWQLIIIGNGEDKGIYESIIQKKHLKNVTMLGKKAPLPFYREASLFAMTSVVEGWGMTLLEAMQCGVVPVVMDTFGAVHDIIDDGENGILIPDRNLDKYAEVLLSLMKDESERKRLAGNAIEKVRCFSPNVIAGQWMKLFTDLLEQKKMSDV